MRLLPSNDNPTDLIKYQVNMKTIVFKLGPEDTKLTSQVRSFDDQTQPYETGAQTREFDLGTSKGTIQATLDGNISIADQFTFMDENDIEVFKTPFITGKKNYTIPISLPSSILKVRVTPEDPSSSNWNFKLRIEGKQENKAPECTETNCDEN